MHQTLTVINVVQDYLADNTGTNDTSDQINAALAHVPVGVSPDISAGAIVYFPQGTYKIKKPLLRKVSWTRCIGEGKNATVILLDAANWQGTVSPADPNAGSFIFDLQSYFVTDCAVTDMLINGSATTLPGTASQSNLYSGILCSVRSEIARVSIYDVWGFGLWIAGESAAYTRVIDCDADKGFNPHYNNNQGSGGNDCIGGGSLRVKIIRFYWMPGLAKNTALDFTTPGGTSFKERSVDIIDCINESPHDVVLEGCVQSTIRGNRFYGNNLAVKSDASYPILTHPWVTNPADILVADNVFMGQLNSQSQWVGGSCQVVADGGIYCTSKGQMGKPLNNAGRIGILGNSFINSAGGDASKPASAILWAGDDKSNSDGGSVIADNRIVNPNPNGSSSTVNIPGGCSGGAVSLGSGLGSGISVLS